LDVKSSEQILIELVNEGVLDMIFAVECQSTEERHQVIVNGIDELTRLGQCEYCGCEYDFENVKVGFKRKRQ
jgi:hypothetical protein